MFADLTLFSLVLIIAAFLWRFSPEQISSSHVWKLSQGPQETGLSAEIQEVEKDSFTLVPFLIQSYTSQTLYACSSSTLLPCSDSPL